MKSMVDSGWDNQIRLEISKGKKLLGICLGMQLLFDSGTEDGDSKG